MKKLPLLVLGVSLLLQPGFAQEQIPDGESLPFSGLTVREARRVNARLQNIYQKAVKEAQEITPGKMSDRLWSVDDPWVDRKGDSLVLVVAAIQTKDLPKWTGKATKQAPASRDEAIWVSLSPELGMVMHNQPLLDSLSAAMRIKQILGLPPQADYGYIVQFWVPVSQLVRPTPDPDVHNHFSTVKFPQQVDPGHKQWIEHLRSTTLCRGHTVLQPKIVNRIELSNRPGNNDSGRFCIFLTVSAKFRPDSVRILSRPRTGQHLPSARPHTNRDSVHDKLQLRKMEASFTIEI